MSPFPGRALPRGGTCGGSAAPCPGGARCGVPVAGFFFWGAVPQVPWGCFPRGGSAPAGGLGSPRSRRLRDPPQGLRGAAPPPGPCVSLCSPRPRASPGSWPRAPICGGCCGGALGQGRAVTPPRALLRGAPSPCPRESRPRPFGAAAPSFAPRKYLASFMAPAISDRGRWLVRAKSQPGFRGCAQPGRGQTEPL